MRSGSDRRPRSVGDSEKVACETDQILEPHRLEPYLRAEVVEFGGHRVIEEVIARHNRHWNRPFVSGRSQAAKETQAVQNRHAEVENDRVGVAFPRLEEAGFGVDGRSYVETLEPQHPRKRLGHSFIVVDDKDLRSG